MKNRIYAAFIFTMLSCLCSSKASASTSNTKDLIRENEALVCFIDFRIQFVIGKTEDEISKNPYNCTSAIDKKTFLRLLSPRPDSEFYMSTNARAEVSMSPDQVYFIDANGTVRLGSKKFVIDKMAFTDALRWLKVKLPPPPKEKGCSTHCGK